MRSTVTVLGCSGTFAGPGGACSGYLLRTAAARIWVDCGPGTLGSIQQHVDLTELDGIVVSHSHPDHWLELPVVRNALRYVLGRPEGRLPLWTTAETADLLATVVGAPVEPTIEVHVIDERSVVEVADCRLRFSRTDHPVETLAVRADTPAGSVAYTADTGDGWELASLGPGIDVALVEATMVDEVAGIAHLTATQAGAQARRAGVARLVLTHLAPGTDADAQLGRATQEFDGPVTVAQIHQRYEL